MEVPAGDAQTTSLLLTKYKASGCYYCHERLKQKRNDHTHLNCPFRSCYLCKKQGHVSNACPYRTKPNAHQSAHRKFLESNGKRARKHFFVRDRELEVNSDRIHPSIVHFRNRQFDCKAVLIGRKVHVKRVTCVEWMPGTETRILSGDKDGALRVWNIGHSISNGWLDVDAIPNGKVFLAHPHSCTISQVALDPRNQDVAYTSSIDGVCTSVNLSSMEEHQFDILQNLNPQGWQGVMSSFKMMYGLRFHNEKQCLFAGVSDGSILCFDPREKGRPSMNARFHRDKVTTIDINPVCSHLLVSASNDKHVRLWDIRKMVPDRYLGSYIHGLTVSSAYFSPNSGTKLLTTSHDNKIRIWNDLHSFQGDVNEFVDAAPLEIIHSHNFHRYLNPFRAMWDPKDWRDDLFICGRYLGDAYHTEGNSEEASMLHPIDMFSANTGDIVHSMVDSAVSLICPMNKFAPNADCILTAASRDLVLWSPPPRGVSNDSKMRRWSGQNGDGHGEGGDGGNDGDDNDDDDQPSKRKKVVRTTVRARASKRRTRA